MCFWPRARRPSTSSRRRTCSSPALRRSTRVAGWPCGLRSGSSVAPKTLQDLTSSDIRRISIANPDHAPYGQAAREALQSAGLWDELQPKLVPGENVLQAFQYAQTGNVDVGLVALSLVATAAGTYEVVPETLHQPINQELAILASSTHQDEAKRFIAFSTGDQVTRDLDQIRLRRCLGRIRVGWHAFLIFARSHGCRDPHSRDCRQPGPDW